jgi:two-component system, NarL family, sensor histidine kinase DesK
VTDVLNAQPGRWRWGWGYAAIWLVLLTPTVSAAVRLPDHPRGWTGLSLLLAFCAVYLRTWSSTRARRFHGQLGSWRWGYGMVALAAALAVAVILLVGQQALAMTPFLVVLVMFLLPSMARLLGAAVILAGTLAAIELVPAWKRDTGIVYGLVVTVFVMLGIVQMTERNAHLARANERLADLAVAEERARFARDLHDLLGHSLTLLAIKAELAGRLVQLDAGRAEQEISAVERLARDALADVRAAVGGYRQTSLSGELVSARAVLDAAGIEAELPSAVDDVPGERRELLGWAVREGVTNVVRHSRASRCRIVVHQDGVEIIDNGQGLTPLPSNAAAGWTLGSGLVGLRERAEAAGATVVVSSGSDGGFQLRVGW